MQWWNVFPMPLCFDNQPVRIYYHKFIAKRNQCEQAWWPQNTMASVGVMLIFKAYTTFVITCLREFTIPHLIDTLSILLVCSQGSARFRSCHQETLITDNRIREHKNVYIDGIVQDCNISSALEMEILQPCTKPSTFTFSIIAQHRGDTSTWNPSSWKKNNFTTCIVSTLVPDDLATQEARASAAMVLT